MPQNLPIQGPQVMEIQGGMRLTPLGLRQLGGLANQVVVPTGGPVAQTAAGSGATVTIDPSTTAPLEPTQIAINIPNQSHSGNGTYNLTLGYGFTITGIDYLVLESGHGSGNSVIINNGIAGDQIAVLNTVSATAGLYLDADKVTGIDPAQMGLTSGDVLSLIVAGGASDKTAGILTLTGLVMP